MKTTIDMYRLRLLLFALVLLLPFLLIAQSPQRFPYRAIIKINGAILANQTFDFRMTISKGGSDVYQETHVVTTDAYGLVSLSVGTGVPLLGSFTAIAWDQGNYTLKVEIDDNGGWINMGTSQLESVPFAFHAQTVENDSSNSYELTTNGNTLILLENSQPKDSVTLTATPITAGTGISISGSTITNIGDTDDTDDITTSTTAGGDLSGLYPDPTVEGLGGIPLAAGALQPNDVLKFINGEWGYVPDEVDDADADPNNEFQLLSVDLVNFQMTIGPGGNTVPLPQYVAGTGINLTGTIINNTGDLDANDDITFGTTAGGDLGGTYPSPVVQGIQGFPVTPLPPATGNVLVFDGSIPQWNLSTVDLDPTDDLVIGMLAGGDLSGTYPDPDVSGIQGHPVSNQNPLNGDVLKFVGGFWVPTTDLFEDGDTDPNNELQVINQNGNQLSLSSGGTVTLFTEGPGIDVVGNTIINTGDTIASDDITFGAVAGGDLSGFYPDPMVVAIQGRAVAATVPSTGQVLKWNGSLWEPANDITSAVPWIQSGNNYTFTGGQVGIGTSNTISPLTIGGNSANVNSSGSARVEAGISGSDGGFVNIYDTNNQAQAGMFINGSGQGELFADVKNFRVDHPTESDKDIWYASLEGPEAAAYVRGTATLVNGTVIVDLPEHFHLIAANDGLTVMLTPLSADSKGLAVIQKDATKFEVKELLQGTGNYSFDWEVKAVRKGHEDFQVIRPKLPRK